MQIQITDAGVALLQSSQGPVALTLAKFGSGVNYTPEPTDTNIHGTLVFSTAPTAPAVVSANIYRYSVIVDLSAPSFDFGEVGLFTSDGTLFALCVSTELIHKLQLTANSFGNSLRLDAYLSMVGSNYDMWLDTAESNNQFRMAVIGSVDQLPQPQNATPNAYVVQGQSTAQASYLAYTDRQGLWNFDAYSYAPVETATVSGMDSQSVTIPLSQYVAAMNPAYFGQVILEFNSGPLYGVCRYVKTAVTSGNNVTLGFDTPVLITPNVGDTFITFQRNSAEVNVIPAATTSAIGGIIVGQSLTVQSDGTLNVDYTKIPYPVKTVAGRTGDIVLTAADVSGLATVATTGSYNDLSNKPAAYVLPVATASVLGGVRAPGNGNLNISGTGVIDLGFTPVSSVNGETGAVTLTASDITGFTSELSIWAQGPLANSEILFKKIPSRNLTLHAGLSGSTAKTGVAATASTVLTLRKNGTAIGTFTFAAGATSATIAFAADVQFTAGVDVLDLIGPATPDLTAADFYITVAGAYQ
jgi:hypothetical protein